MTSNFRVTNPATGQVETTYEPATAGQVLDAIAESHAAFAVWRAEPVGSRALALKRASGLLAERKNELATDVAREMGKRFVDAQGEIDVAIAILDYYADNAEALLADKPLPNDTGARAFIRKSATGVLLGIMPWNYPYYQVARFVAPNLAAGNTVLIKHAAQCPATADNLERLFHDAGLPVGAYVNLYADHDLLESVIADERVVGVSLTGSERAGSAVAALAGKHLKKVVLELGGSDPYLILDTDDMAGTVAIATKARLSNGGQSCNAGKRFIVLDALYDDFVARLSETFAAQVPGDPFAESSTYGPMSSIEARDGLAAQVDDAVAQGATVRAGGNPAEGAGAYMQATVLTDVPPSARAYREELFGPVAVVHRAASIDEAVEIANDTPFGLGAAVFHTDLAVAEAIADRIDAGMVFVNAREGGGPELPFGGTKRSGFGRELGPEGIDEFVNKKLIHLPA